MNQTQKIIKYLAFAFAVFLIVSIVSGIMYSFFFLGNLFGKEEGKDFLEPVMIDENTLVLEIDVFTSNIIIKEGETLSFQTNNKYIDSAQENNRFSIKEKRHNWFSQKQELILFVPKDFHFNEVEIETGAGKVTIEQLSTNQLSLNLGAGNISIENLMVLEKAKIESGAGKLEIHDGTIQNLDFDMGVGSVSLTSKLTGNTKINTGVGTLQLSLIGTLEDYSITLDKGLGNATIQNEPMNGDMTYGTGMNRLEIDDGVGNIKIHLIEGN